MAQWVYCNDTGASLTQSQSTFAGLTGAVQATEPHARVQVYASFTAKNLVAYCSAVSGTATVRDRKGAANGGMSLSFSTTGQKEDVTNTTSLANGDELCFQAVCGGSHGNTLTLQSMGLQLDDAGAGVGVWAATASDNTGAGPRIGSLFSGHSGDLVQGTKQYKVKAAHTLTKFRVYVSANTKTNAPTIKVLKNGADGNLTISLTALTTGEFEDTSNSDTLAANDLVNWSYTNGTDTGNSITIPVVQVSAAGACHYLDHYLPGGYGASVTSYLNVGGIKNGTTTEANHQVRIRVADVFENPQVYVGANTRSDASTINWRVDSTTQLQISVGAGVTGLVEDTDSYTSVATELVNWSVVTGAGTGTLTANRLGIQQGKPPGARPVYARSPAVQRALPRSTIRFSGRPAVPMYCQERGAHALGTMSDQQARQGGYGAAGACEQAWRAQAPLDGSRASFRRWLAGQGRVDGRSPPPRA